MIAHADVPIGEHQTPSAESLCEVLRGAPFWRPGYRLEEIAQEVRVPDATSKFNLREESGRCIACAIAGYAAAGLVVARAAKRSHEIQSLLSRETRGAVLPPFYQAESGGLVVACYEWRDPMPGGVFGLIRRRRVRHSLFRWLRMVAGQSIGGVSIADVRFRECLLVVASEGEFSLAMRKAAEHAIERLDAKVWSPQHQIDHNDLWSGNVRLSGTGSHGDWSFSLIDWADSNPRGFGMYDLVRLSSSFGLSTARLAREVRSHCSAKGCSEIDAMGMLLASIGHLGTNLRCFPSERFVAVAERCFRTLSAIGVQG
ncbi:MAG: hypothetical protein JSR77_11625 [Planctomycetes bacterium]|nr:hypothetical protein [Planctomycetota bacterium]